MSQSELLKKLSAFLERDRIGYFLTGSLASSLQGEPRATHDIDLVVELAAPAVAKLAAAFPTPDYYLDEPAALEAVRRRQSFNLIEVKSGAKVDFWLLTDEPFDRSRFSRRKREELMGIALWVSAPEDTILVKLRWAKLSGGSEKQFGDALRVFEVQSDRLDRRYLDHWAGLLQIDDLYRRLLEEAQPLLLP
jgi:hypothetical protein